MISCQSSGFASKSDIATQRSHPHALPTRGCGSHVTSHGEDEQSSGQRIPPHPRLTASIIPRTGGLSTSESFQHTRRHGRIDNSEAKTPGHEHALLALSRHPVIFPTSVLLFHRPVVISSMPFSLSSPPSPFPTYLVPSLPFRRRKSSTSSSISTISTSPSSPPQHETYLSSSTSHLRCTRCLADLALSSQIISKGFTGRHGRAYLVSATASSHHYSSTDPTTATNTARALPNLPNTYTHKPVPRQLVTGAHTVADVSCAHCGSVLGWKYVAAEDESQRYKVGKFILETKRVCRVGGWDVVHEEEEGVEGEDGCGEDRGPASAAELDDVEFDSQDDDECDALFAGQWTARFAQDTRRRSGKSRRPLLVSSVEE